MLVHSNRVCLVGLAPSHPIVRDQVIVGLSSHLAVTEPTLLDSVTIQALVCALLLRLIRDPSVHINTLEYLLYLITLTMYEVT